MLNKNIYEQEKDFEEFNTYQNLKSKIVSKFLPFSSIFQFFIFDRDKLKTFLIEYYNIHIKLRELYYILFSFIELPEMDYLKNNRKPLTRAFKTIDLFNISRFSNIANFLNDEFNKKISEISNENQELFLEKIKIISQLIGKIEKTEDFLSYSDSSISRKNLQELNSVIYDQAISLWDSIENFRLNTDEYNKFEFYNSPKISFLSDSIDCLKKLDYPEEQIQKFIGWELLFDKSKFYLKANTSSYSNNMYYSDNIENTNSIRNLFIENTSDPEIAVSKLFSIISSFPTLVPAKYQGDGRYTENIYYFDGQDSISPIKFQNIEYDGPSMLFFPEQTWTNRNEFYIGFLYLQRMWTFGEREVFYFSIYFRFFCVHQ